MLWKVGWAWQNELEEAGRLVQMKEVEGVVRWVWMREE